MWPDLLMALTETIPYSERCFRNNRVKHKCIVVVDARGLHKWLDLLMALTETIPLLERCFKKNRVKHKCIAVANARGLS